MQLDDPQLRERMREGEPVIRRVARRMRRILGKRIEAEEIDALANLALAEALRSHDPTRAEFKNYVGALARWTILTGMRQETHGREVVARARLFLGVELAISAHENASRGKELLEHDEQTASLTELLDAQAGAIAVGLVAFGSEASITAAVATPEDQLARAEEASALRHAVEQLPERERALVRRYFFGDECVAAIASDLGLSRSWASRVLEQAIQTLRRALMKTA